MRTITTTAGTSVELDGDVLAVLEAISRDLTRRRGLEYGFEEIDREFQSLVQQMNDGELRVYLKESLFMSFNRFENDRMMAIMNKAHNATAQEARPPKANATKSRKPAARRTAKSSSVRKAKKKR